MMGSMHKFKTVKFLADCFTTSTCLKIMRPIAFIFYLVYLPLSFNAFGTAVYVTFVNEGQIPGVYTIGDSIGLPAWNYGGGYNGSIGSNSTFQAKSMDTPEYHTTPTVVTG